MKWVQCKEKCGTRLERILNRGICTNCKRKKRTIFERSKAKKEQEKKKCDICWKLPKCTDDKHWDIRFWLYYYKGEAHLSEAGKKSLGHDYLEKLRCTNQLKTNFKSASGVELESYLKPTDIPPHVKTALSRSK